MAKQDFDGLHYARAGQIRRALNERANAVAYGQTERVKAVDKELAELGYADDAASAPEVRRDKPPVDRTTTSPAKTVSTTTDK